MLSPPTPCLSDVPIHDVKKEESGKESLASSQVPEHYVVIHFENICLLQSQGKRLIGKPWVSTVGDALPLMFLEPFQS